MARQIRVELVGDAGKLHAELGKAEKRFSGFGDHIGSVGKLGAAAFTGAVVAAGAVAAAGLADQFFKALDREQMTANLAARLALDPAEQERAGRVAGEVWAGGYGTGLDQVNEALAAVDQNIGDLEGVTDKAMAGMSTDALNLSSVFDVDVGGTVRAVGQLIRNGLVADATAGFDVLAAGFQGGADRAGDLLDTIEEYSPSFSALGFTGEQALGVIAAGLDAGARNGDLAADAFKEFSIRVVDGSDLTREGFRLAGLDADTMVAAITAGGPAAVNATSTIITAIAGIADPVQREAAGVALFGTQFEDLGIKVITAMDPAAVSIGSTAGAADSLGVASETAQSKWETFSRGVQNAVQTYFVDDVIPNVETLIRRVGPDLSAAFLGTATSGSLDAEQLSADTTAAFDDLAVFITGDLIPAIQLLREFFGFLGDTAGAVWRGINVAAERTGQVVFGAVGFLNEIFLGFAEDTIRAAQLAFGWVPGLGGKLQTAHDAVAQMRTDVNARLAEITRSVPIDVDTEPARVRLTSFYNDWSRKSLSWEVTASAGVGRGLVSGSGDGPGKAVGGSALAKVRQLMAGIPGLATTSTYRDPAHNARVGGSRNSYHMDRSNPAVDVVGPGSSLDRLYAALKRVGGRELIWRAPGHYDHLHYAHEGGTVSAGWPTLPGLRADERPVVTQVGERIVARGGDQAVVAAVHAAAGHQTQAVVAAVHAAANFIVHNVVTGLRQQPAATRGLTAADFTRELGPEHIDAGLRGISERRLKELGLLDNSQAQVWSTLRAAG